MITIDYHPIVQAVVESWRRELPLRDSPCTVSERDLRDLIQRLTTVIDVLTTSRDCPVALLSRQPESPCGPCPTG